MAPSFIFSFGPGLMGPVYWHVGFSHRPPPPLTPHYPFTHFDHFLCRSRHYGSYSGLPTLDSTRLPSDRTVATRTATKSVGRPLFAHCECVSINRNRRLFFDLTCQSQLSIIRSRLNNSTQIDVQWSVAAFLIPFSTNGQYVIGTHLTSIRSLD